MRRHRNCTLNRRTFWSIRNGSYFSFIARRALSISHISGGFRSLQPKTKTKILPAGTAPDRVLVVYTVCIAARLTLRVTNIAYGLPDDVSIFRIRIPGRDELQFICTTHFSHPKLHNFITSDARYCVSLCVCAFHRHRNCT